MATQRQINIAELDTDRVRTVNMFMKEINYQSDSLYEDMIDRDMKGILFHADKLIETSNLIKSSIEKIVLK